MKINVSEQNIKEGRPESCEWCPVARALREIYPSAGTVEVDTDYIRVWIPHAQRWKTPDIVADFIAAFDAGEPVAPIAFDLDEEGE